MKDSNFVWNQLFFLVSADEPCCLVFSNSCLTAFSSGSSSPVGHLFLSFSQSGPSHHLDTSNFLGEQPLDGRSAGFMLPGTNLQLNGAVSRISFTLFLI